MFKEDDSGKHLTEFIYFVGRNKETSSVPFTQDEIDTLERLKSLFGQGNFNPNNSGYARELSSTILIPWGRALKNRPQALSTIKRSLEKVEEGLKINHVQIDRIRPQLESLREGLSSFFE